MENNTLQMIKLLFAIVVLFLLLIIIVWNVNYKPIHKGPELINYRLSYINCIQKRILEELNSLLSTKKGEWIPWPEKELYSNSWSVIPFYGFDTWVEKNCLACPQLFHFLKTIPGLKLAALSKLGPHSSLVPHRGWGNYSNKVIRCHFGVDVPENCHIYVEKPFKKGEYAKEKHKTGEWLVFDDSRSHYADNQSDKERIVLIIDVARPFWIKDGTSKEPFSKELEDFIAGFTRDNSPKV